MKEKRTNICRISFIATIMFLSGIGIGIYMPKLRILGILLCCLSFSVQGMWSRAIKKYNL